jgi:hypothetical protein
MKTAMQEFLEWLENSSDVQNDILNWRIVKENALEKEKEQIINAYEDGKENQRESITNIYKYIIGEYYYNQTYNQNK